MSEMVYIYVPNQFWKGALSLSLYKTLNCNDLSALETLKTYFSIPNLDKAELKKSKPTFLETRTLLKKYPWNEEVVLLFIGTTTGYKESFLYSFKCHMGEIGTFNASHESLVLPPLWHGSIYGSKQILGHRKVDQGRFRRLPLYPSNVFKKLDTGWLSKLIASSRVWCYVFMCGAHFIVFRRVGLRLFDLLETKFTTWIQEFLFELLNCLDFSTSLKE